MPTPSDPDHRPPRPVHVVNAASPRLQARIAALHASTALAAHRAGVSASTLLASAAEFEAWLLREEDR